MTIHLQETPSFSQDLKRYAGLLWHRAWLIILAVLLAGVTAYLVSQQMTPVYQTTATMLVEQASSLNTSAYIDIWAEERSILTYTEMMIKAPILDGVIEALNLDMDHRDLQGLVQVQMVRDTKLVEVTVTDTNPQRAAAIANTVVAVFSREIQEMQALRYRDSKANMETQMGELQKQLNQVADSLAAEPEPTEKDRLEALQAQYQETFAFLLQAYEEIRLIESQSSSNMIAFEPAEAPTRPIRPRVFQNTLLAAVVGGMLAVGLIFLIDVLDDTLRRPEDIDFLGLPVLGIISRTEKNGENMVTVSHPRNPVSEAYRALRTNIQYASIDEPIRTVIVTSALPREGKTTVATNLATVMAQGESKVVIIDADLRQPKVHRKLQISNRRGLSELMIQGEEVALDGFLRATKTPNLSALPSGSLPPTPSEFLRSEKMNRILELAKEHADLVVVDSPPVLAVTDACVLAPRIDGVLLVNAKILGVVINDVKGTRSSYYYRHYYPYYQGAEESI